LYLEYDIYHSSKSITKLGLRLCDFGIIKFFIAKLIKIIFSN